MSNYNTKAKRPNGKEFEEVSMLDNLFGQHNYGVQFPDKAIFKEEDCEFEEEPKDLIKEFEGKFIIGRDGCFYIKKDADCFDGTVEVRATLEGIKRLFQKAISQTEKAFGGCKNCYGKGYHTTIEYASGRGEWDMGQGDVKIHYQLPEMRFCDCDRGKELKKRFEATEKEAYEKGRLETLKEIEDKLPEEIKSFDKSDQSKWGVGYKRIDNYSVEAFNVCVKKVKSIINQLKVG